MFTVVLDACVLVPITLTDTILRIAEAGSVGVRWSPRILDETRRALVSNGVGDEAADRRLRHMASAFPLASVVAPPGLESVLTNHPKDRHVLATAISAPAPTIVTFNLKDFPAASLQPWEVEAIHPDEFLLNQLDLGPGAVVKAVRRQAGESTRPRRSVDQIIGGLARCGVPEFADEVRRHLMSPCD
ncbi:PIN domain-containing protein [Mariniluteicoccus flavus]